MAANKKRFKLKIANKNYVVIGDSTPEHMRAVSHLVNEQLTEIMSENVSREDAAVLLAINAVSDQLRKQKELDDIKDKKSHDGEQ
ncbi:cell division protein ZapA [Ligilactobacillus pobuzihii]|uniref:Stimulator of FtsZ polymerization and component of cell-division Z-ring n=1 Tax=Ligilactobacillus pobuzihii TaxID=449659 RepID=A0A0R2LAZ2_9LACO|nr:cell division protein ZapA [Ligilactobacillus pobuzihii]KRK10025.1 hypothetical protein FD11_GL000269 [Ligilactobacillus pobuzihii E100301 = KCTC 13174]KRN96250.1 hypothetical protein IV66_GL000744 [Ligilactobacillus pobuzihii]GEN48446.1 hypothetical protein LPO01_12380 [Ligilactobacillus pobuzihii]